MNAFACRGTALLLACLPLPLLQAQQKARQAPAPAANPSAPHSFALVLGASVEAVNLSWRTDDTLYRYAHAHPGRYILFLQDGALHRLDREENIRTAETAYAPMQALAARQTALAVQQRPLAAQQRALSAEMRAASTPLEMQRIGAAQASVGQQQGALGSQQGEIGRQQGELGKTLDTMVQGMINACLQEGTCPALGS